MEGNLGFLFAAVTATWLVLFVYLLFLSGRLASLRRELEAVRRGLDHSDGEREP